MKEDRFAIKCAKDFYRCKKGLEGKGIHVNEVSESEIRFGDNYVKVSYGKLGKVISYALGNLASEIKIGVPAKGYGRWIYCKYCYRNVPPYIFDEELELMGRSVKQTIVVCPFCTSGLKISKHQVVPIEISP